MLNINDNQLASWNITGFHVRVHNVEEFIDSLDDLGLVETLTHQESPISLPGYKHPPAKELKKKCRRSGDILVYYKDTFDNGIKLMSKYEIWLWYGVWLVFYQLFTLNQKHPHLILKTHFKAETRYS